MKLDDYDKKIIEQVQNITLTDFGIKGNNVTKDIFISMLEEMICEVDRLKEKNDTEYMPNYEDIERDREYDGRNN